jgi:DNA invertase Pin-like site-specific DNA recombinase
LTPSSLFKNQIQAQVAALTAAGAVKVYREVASGAKTDRVQLRQVLAKLAAGDVLLVTRLDRLARSTRDLLNTLAAITGTGAGFTSLGDAWADTTKPPGRLMLTILGGLAEFECELIRARAKAGGVRLDRPPEAHPLPAARGSQPPRQRRATHCDHPLV